jgi:Protein of unknown function (DUF1579)
LPRGRSKVEASPSRSRAPATPFTRCAYKWSKPCDARRTLAPSSTRFFAIVIVAILAIAVRALEHDDAIASADSVNDVPNWVSRGLPGPGHAALEPLIGKWSVRMSIHALLGRTENDPPLVSDDLVATRQWIAGGRYLEDTTTGSMASGSYWRRGWLGYSNVDARYEWVTVDAVNANMMSYAAQRESGPHTPITMLGMFTDQGVTGERNAGRIVLMRTVIHICSNDYHVIELYVMPPGEPEVLATRMDYTRLDHGASLFPSPRRRS